MRCPVDSDGGLSGVQLSVQIKESTHRPIREEEYFVEILGDKPVEKHQENHHPEHFPREAPSSRSIGQTDDVGVTPEVVLHVSVLREICS